MFRVQKRKIRMTTKGNAQRDVEQEHQACSRSLRQLAIIAQASRARACADTHHGPDNVERGTGSRSAFQRKEHARHTASRRRRPGRHRRFLHRPRATVSRAWQEPKRRKGNSAKPHRKNAHSLSAPTFFLVAKHESRHVTLDEFYRRQKQPNSHRQT